MSEWTKVSVKKEHVETAFSDTVARSKRLPAGVHNNVRIVSVSPISGYPGIILEWENELGLTMEQYVFSTYNDRDTNDTKFSPVYIHLATALCGDDMELYQDVFLSEYQNDPSILNNVKGLYANIRVGMPKRGLSLKKVGERYAVYDLNTGEIDRSFSPSEDGFFSTFTEAKDAVKEQGKRIQYNCVLGTYPSAENISANRKQLRNAYDEARVAKSAQVSKPKAVQGF